MKAIELRKKTGEELKSVLMGKLLRREELILMLRQKKAKNVKELSLVRKDIARIITVLNQARYENS